jgi:hypothetical protein
MLPCFVKKYTHAPFNALLVRPASSMAAPPQTICVPPEVKTLFCRILSDPQAQQNLLQSFHVEQLKSCRHFATGCAW